SRIEFRELADNHLTVGGQVMWQDQTQINFFGVGPDSLDADQSQYQLRFTDFVGYATYLPRPSQSFALTGEVGWLDRPKVMSPGGTFKSDLPTTQRAFPNVPGVGLAFQPTYAHTEWSVYPDTRNHRSYPTHGGLYRVAATTFNDQSTGTFTFQQYEA